MDHSRELIEACLQRCRPNHLSADLARELAKIAAIQFKVRRAEQMGRDLYARYQDQTKAIDRELAEIRSTCPHPLTRREYESPPHCTICGAEL